MLEEGDQVAVGTTALRYTREAIPPGIRVELGGGELDTVASVRPTLVMQEAITAEMPVVGRAPGWRARPWASLAIGLVVILLALLAIFVL